MKADIDAQRVAVAPTGGQGCAKREDFPRRADAGGVRTRKCPPVMLSMMLPLCYRRSRPTLRGKPCGEDDLPSQDMDDEPAAALLAESKKCAAPLYIYCNATNPTRWGSALIQWFIYLFSREWSGRPLLSSTRRPSSHSGKLRSRRD